MKPADITPGTGIALANQQPALALSSPDERGLLTVAIVVHKNDVMIYPTTGDVVVLTMLPDGLTKAGKIHDADALSAFAALAGLHHGDEADPCWCDAAIGNPMVPDHTAECSAARRVWGFEK